MDDGEAAGRGRVSTSTFARPCCDKNGGVWRRLLVPRRNRPVGSLSVPPFVACDTMVCISPIQCDVAKGHGRKVHNSKAVGMDPWVGLQHKATTGNKPLGGRYNENGRGPPTSTRLGSKPLANACQPPSGAQCPEPDHSRAASPVRCCHGMPPTHGPLRRSDLPAPGAGCPGARGAGPAGGRDVS